MVTPRIPDPQLEAVSLVQAESALAAPRLDFDDTEKLDLDVLIPLVLQRNPSLQAATAAWQAATERIPQVTSLDDPQMRAMGGPRFNGPTFFDAFADDWDVSYFRWQCVQKFPWPGKRGLRGAIATAESDAAFQDIGEVRLHLVEAIRHAYADYWLVVHQQALLEQEEQLGQEYAAALRQFIKDNVAPAYLLHKVELTRLERQRRREELAVAEKGARGRLNTLLHRPPDCPLPFPRSLTIVPLATDIEELRQAALAHHPQYKAALTRLQADDAAIALAEKEFYPDIEALVRFDTVWTPDDVAARPIIGIHFDLPIRKERRRAAVREAQALRAKRRAEVEQLAARILYEIQFAHDQLQRSQNQLKQYPQLLAAAQELSRQVHKQAECLDAWFEAQRQLLYFQSRQYEDVHHCHRLLASLERAVGAPLLIVPDVDGNGFLCAKNSDSP
ncbi:MAG: TolC family protein [Gemmataceae bacterium]